MGRLRDWFSKNRKNNIPTIVMTAIFSTFFGVVISSFNIKVTWGWLRFLFLTFDLKISAFLMIVFIVGFYGGLRFARYLIYSRRKLRILKATYGAGDNQFDITEELNKAVTNSELEILVSNSIAGDPAVGTQKVATVHYQYGVEKGSINIREGEVLKLPPRSNS